MVYSINGVPLDASGWHMAGSSEPLMSVSVDITSSRSSGRDGVTHAGAVRGLGSMKFGIQSDTAEARQSLLALFSQPVLTVTSPRRPGHHAVGKLRGTSVDLHAGFMPEGEDTFLVEIPGGCWRDAVESTSALGAAQAGGRFVSVWPGLSAPVQDAVVRVKGPIQKPQIIDSAGSFVALDGDLTASQWWRFDAKTGRSWLTTTDTWTGGTELSALVDFGGPRRLFEVTPRFPTPSDPTVREGRVQLIQAGFSAGAGVQIRGRGAYLG